MPRLHSPSELPAASAWQATRRSLALTSQRQQRLSASTAIDLHRSSTSPQLDSPPPPNPPCCSTSPALLTHEIGNEHSYLMESSLTCTDGMARFAWRICQSLCEAEGRRGMRSESHKRGEICSCVDANRMYEVWLSGRQGARKVARDRQRANEGIIKWNNVWKYNSIELRNDYFSQDALKSHSQVNIFRRNFRTI